MTAILLVDDRPENLFLLEEVLQADGRELIRASSGNEALRLLLKQDFACVLLDVEMPGMDGYETATLMRGAERTRHIPIIFVTAGDRTEERTFRGYESGAVDFLYKPIDTHVLACKVDIFVELHRRGAALQQMNAQLRATSTALAERVADLEDVHRTLSHDLRGPLRSIIGFSRALDEEAGSTLDPTARGHLDRVLRAGERLQTMVDDLFELLKLSARTSTLIDLDMGVVFDDVLAVLRADIEASAAVVTYDPMPRVLGNPALVGVVLRNLIANALKFSDGPPEIHVQVIETKESTRFRICDRGTGIAAEDRTRIFQLFQRGDESRPGTGVGLALCQRAIEKCGGRIWAEANEPRGSAFCFELPRRSILQVRL